MTQKGVYRSRARKCANVLFEYNTHIHTHETNEIIRGVNNAIFTPYLKVGKGSAKGVVVGEGWWLNMSEYKQ